jgi:DNA topoisomerase-1
MPPKRYYKKTPEKAFQKTGTWLVIVESPSKCKKIEEYLGSAYQCIASKGHIRTIEGLKSIDTKRDFTPTFTEIPEKANHIAYMRSIIAQFPKENIFVATDDDREGEAIGWHICEVFELPAETTKRILFHEITKIALQQAVATPTILNMSVIYAQHSRQVLDVIVGYTISPLLWKHIYNDKTNGLSAGRCQTPALRLIYDHDIQSQKRKIEIQYKTMGNFFERNIRFELNRKHETEEMAIAFLEKSREFRHILSILPLKETYKNPPKPFTTSRLLQSASSILHFSPKTTMEMCQQLYQMGLITYMRTDSGKYSAVFLKQAETYILREWNNLKYVGDLTLLENTEAGNPHEAIRVTNIHMSFITDDNKGLVSLYRFIWKNTLESCMTTATYKTHPVRITAPENAYYEYTLEIPVFQGWKRASSSNHSEDGTDTAQQQGGLLMYLNTFIDKPIIVQYIESIVCSTEGGTKHYTEASLIQTLEELGIGRPSTYATIVETIQERGYVKKKDVKGNVLMCNEYKLVNPNVVNSDETHSSAHFANTLEKTQRERVFGNEKGKLIIQPTGMIVIEFLLQYFESVFSYDYTKTMETQLDKVSETDARNASLLWREICRECHILIKQLKKPLSKINRETYSVDKDVVLVFHKNGASLKRTLEDGTIEYKSVKKNMDIDLGKLKRGEYSIDELIEIPEECLGVYAENEVLLKSGKYGAYVECGDIKVSIKDITKPLDTIVLNDILPILIMKKREKEQHELGSITTLDISKIPDKYQDASIQHNEDTHMIIDAVTVAETNTTFRVLNSVLSVRNGKYGAYVYYQKPGVKKPTFLNIKKFKDNCWSCDPNVLLEWLHSTYNV